MPEEDAYLFLILIQNLILVAIHNIRLDHLRMGRNPLLHLTRLSFDSELSHPCGTRDRRPPPPKDATQLQDK